MWRPRVLQIKITENSTAELQSATPTRGGVERGQWKNEREGEEKTAR